MRILITASTLPRWKDDSVPEFVLDQARAFKKCFGDEIDLYILAPHHEGAARKEVVDGITIYRFRYFFPERLQRLVYPAILPNIRVARWLVLQVPLLLLAELFSVYRLTRRLKPDVLYSHWFMPQAAVGSVVAALTGVPHVFTSHSSDVQIMRTIPVLGTWIVRAVIRRMHAFTVVSRRSRAKLQAFFGPDEWSGLSKKMRVIPMGVDTGALEDKVNEDADGFSGKGTRVLLFMGRLSEKKGLDYLLEAFKLVSDEGHDARLWIAGDGELFAQVQRKIAELGLENSVSMLGYVTGEEKLKYLRDAHILVVPSIITEDGDAEGLPVSLLEGLAAGKVCIATDASGADDILVDGVSGVLIPQKDTHRLAEAIVRVLEMDGGGFQQMSLEGRRRVGEFDWTRVAQRHFEHLFANIPLQKKAVNNN